MKKRTMIILILVLIVLGVLFVITSTARDNLLVKQAVSRFQNFIGTRVEESAHSNSTLETPVTNAGII